MTMRHEAGPIEVFVSYSHRDDDLREELLRHLSILRRQGVIAGWHDRMIGAGTEWRGQIDAHLDSARIILLLVSANFLASDYCYDIELTRALERHDRGEARVIPIILRPVDWKDAPFAKLGVLPRDGRPVTTWPDRDEALLDVALGIRAAARALRGPRDATSGPRSTPPPRDATSGPGSTPPPPDAARPGPDRGTGGDPAGLEGRCGTWDFRSIARPGPAAGAAGPQDWDPHVLQRAQRDLTSLIGPMAALLVPRAAGEAQTLPQLYQLLAAQIPSAEKRTKFLASQPR